MIIRWRNLCVAFMALAIVAGCGFKLRGDQQLPAGVQQVRLSAASPHMPLQRELEKQLTLFKIPYSVEQSPLVTPDTLDIRLEGDSLNRRLLSLFPTGQVAEYELILTVRYQVAFPGRAPQQVEFEVTREYQDDPDAILAKSRELQLVLTEMRQQASERIVRLLASQASGTS